VSHNSIEDVAGQIMKLVVAQDVYETMVAAAQKAAPLEACGLLGGKGQLATEFYELENVDASAEHYSMRPEEQFAAVKDMRAKEARLQAIWHSHPATPARMSEEDLRLAYTPGTVYAILSLADPEKPDLRGFIINNGQSEEVEMTLQ